MAYSNMNEHLDEAKADQVLAGVESSTELEVGQDESLFDKLTKTARGAANTCGQVCGATVKMITPCGLFAQTDGADLLLTESTM